MISSLIEFLAGIVIDIISALGYAGVFLAMAIESACIPLPSEIIMPFSGYLVFTGVFAYVGGNTPVNLLLVGVVGALGNLAGSLLAYWVGAKGGRPLVEKYGKWVLIRHTNGLTTLYAHLSVVSVSAGAQVATGDIIGYSGDTGYALGPHLHFTVYASKAVTFKEYTCNSGATLTIPIAAFSGYLDPMLYLPAI